MIYLRYSILIYFFVENTDGFNSNMIPKYCKGIYFILSNFFIPVRRVMYSYNTHVFTLYSDKN